MQNDVQTREKKEMRERRKGTQSGVLGRAKKREWELKGKEIQSEEVKGEMATGNWERGTEHTLDV